jgi:hypothetical protein
MLLPQVNTNASSQALQEFAAHIGYPGETNMGWHTSRQVNVPTDQRITALLTECSRLQFTR